MEGSLLVVVVLSVTISSCRTQTFRNPILDGDSPDPWILRHNGRYLLTYTLHNRIEVFQNDRLENWRQAKSAVIYQPNSQEYTELWAPETHVVGGELYLYFAANKIGTGHRMFVLKANNANDPLGQWTWMGQISDPVRDWWAIDATVFQHQNSKNYLIYAGNWEGTPGLLMIIAELNDPPTTLVANSSRLLNWPTFSWEANGNVTEGPAVIDSGDHYYVMYSGSSTWTDDYCLGMLRIKKTADPMNPNNYYKFPQPVFTKNVEDSVFGTGHASFTVSPDGKEHWMVYHAMNKTYQEGNNRTARVQRFWLQDDGTPVFPRAEGFLKELKSPSSSSTALYTQSATLLSFWMLISAAVV